MRTIFVVASIIAGLSSVAAAPCVPNAKKPAQSIDDISKMSGGLLSSKVRDTVIAEPDKVADFKNMAEHASPEAANAIGAGLGAAAILCARNDPGAGRGIQEFVIALNSPDLTKSFEAISGDLQSAAVTDEPAAPDRVVQSTSGSGENPGRTAPTNASATEQSFSASINVTGGGDLPSSPTSFVGGGGSRGIATDQALVFAPVSPSR